MITQNMNIDDLEIESLPSVDMASLHLLPAAPGVYFAADDNKVVHYVGLATDLRQRWEMGHNRGVALALIQGIRIYYLIEVPSRIAAIESQAILRFKPVLNIWVPKENKDYLEQKYQDPTVVRAKIRSVAVRSCKGRLRLVWTWRGKRFFFVLKMDDTLMNRAAAQILASTIALDIAKGSFDPTLAKYQQDQIDKDHLTASSLLLAFQEHKKEVVSKATLSKYKALESHLTSFFNHTPARSVTAGKSRTFTGWLATKMTPRNVYDRITILNACWDWAIGKGLVSLNPWAKELSQLTKGLSQSNKT
jgi:hypothetical protein